MPVEEALSTTRSVRRRLDLSRPVDRALIDDCLQLAVQAPNGGNRQPWRFLVLDEPAVKAGVAGHYRAAHADYLGAHPAAEPTLVASSAYLAEHLHEVPVLVLGCLLGRRDGQPTARQSSFFGSLYPALWSFMLAARARGLGTSLTTVHLAREREVAELLGIPHAAVTQVALLAVGHTLGAGFRPAARRPVGEVRHFNRWPGEAG